MTDHFAAAIESLKIARKELRHADSHDFADQVDTIVAALEGDDESFDGDNLTDAEADAMTLASAGMGTDEDYGYYGGDGE